MSFRKKKIAEILSYLENLKQKKTEYISAILDNIKFFESIGSLRSFFLWLKTTYPKINKKELLELTDFEDTSYNTELHKSLIGLERSFVPGFISPIVNKASSIIKKKESPILIADFGSGSSELSRQIIKKTIKNKHKYAITIVSFEKSKRSQKTAINNLRLCKEIEIIEKQHLTEEDLLSIHSNNNSIKVVMCNNNIFEMKEDFKNIQFDLSYNSYFKHHLNKDEKLQFEIIAKEKSKIALEYDGYSSKTGIIIQTFAVWKFPVLFNGAVFSNIRYDSKEELKNNSNASDLKIYRFGRLMTYRGAYLRIYQNN